MKMIQRSKVDNQSSVCPPFPQKKNTHQSGSISNPNYQLNEAIYKSCSRKGTTVSVSKTEISTAAKTRNNIIQITQKGRLDLVGRFERLTLILGRAPSITDCYDAGFTMEEIDLLELTIDDWLHCNPKEWSTKIGQPIDGWSG